MVKVKGGREKVTKKLYNVIGKQSNFKSVHLLHKLDTQTSQINLIYMASIYCIRLEHYFQLDGSSHFEENLFYKRYDEQVLIFSRVSVGVKFLRVCHAYKAWAAFEKILFEKIFLLHATKPQLSNRFP